jgi:hypothetical protein
MYSTPGARDRECKAARDYPRAKVTWMSERQGSLHGKAIDAWFLDEAHIVILEITTGPGRREAILQTWNVKCQEAPFKL